MTTEDNFIKDVYDTKQLPLAFFEPITRQAKVPGDIFDNASKYMLNCNENNNDEIQSSEKLVILIVSNDESSDDDDDDDIEINEDKKRRKYTKEKIYIKEKD
ncbi:7122_t:CDS:2 [Entrophospora sp. SA101]|nr:7122_t:CDS:2 [Entrophospora sp. SA101]